MWHTYKHLKVSGSRNSGQKILVFLDHGMWQWNVCHSGNTQLFSRDLEDDKDPDTQAKGREDVKAGGHGLGTEESHRKSPWLRSNQGAPRNREAF